MYVVTAVDCTYLEITQVFVLITEAQVYQNYLTNSLIPSKLLTLNKAEPPNYLLLTFDSCGKTKQGRLFTNLSDAECYKNKLEKCWTVKIICLTAVNCGEPITQDCCTGFSKFECC